MLLKFTRKSQIRVNSGENQMSVCLDVGDAVVCICMLHCTLHANQQPSEHTEGMTGSSINIHICLHAHTMVIKYTLLFHIILTPTCLRAATQT